MLTLYLSFVALMGAVSSDSTCNIVPFSHWSGTTYKKPKPLTKPVELVVIQHTVTSPCATDAECMNILRNMRSAQMNSGFADIGYSFIVGGNGKVYEGAGWNFVGAHTKNYNRRSLGIAFIGDYRDVEPTKEALEAVEELLACGVEEKHLDGNYKLVGHRQLRPTISPGDALQSIIETWPHWTDSVTGPNKSN